MLAIAKSQTALGVITVIFLTVVALAGLAFGTVFAGSGSGGGGDALEFKAELTGADEVPAVVTDTTGMAGVMFNAEMSAADFEVKVDDGMAVIASHFHCAPAGQNGPVIAFIFGEIPGGFDVDGDLAQFTLTDANILPAGESCPMPVTDIGSLAEAMTAGDIYVNVHTIAYPGGEIRGQLMSD